MNPIPYNGSPDLLKYFQDNYLEWGYSQLPKVCRLCYRICDGNMFVGDSDLCSTCYGRLREIAIEQGIIKIQKPKKITKQHIRFLKHKKSTKKRQLDRGKKARNHSECSEKLRTPEKKPMISDGLSILHKKPKEKKYSGEMAMLSPRLGFSAFNEDVRRMAQKTTEPKREYPTNVFDRYERAAITRAINKDREFLTDFEFLCLESYETLNEMLFFEMPQETEFKNGRCL